jgi:aspartate/methionine/tyrosine aminotransferase
MKIISRQVSKIPTSATVGIADRVTQLRQKGADIVDLSAGRAFEKTPDYIIQAALKALAQGHTHQTMAAGTPEFRGACCQKLMRENEIAADPDKEIIATAGVKQGLTLALMATVNPGDEVIVEDPCFVSYLPLIALCGGRPVPVPLRPENNFRWAAEELEKHVTGRTKAILLNSPHNPTGTVHTREDLQIISDIAIKHDLYVITDEVYERVSWGGRRHRCLATLPGMRARTLTVMGLSKTFSMGGWRIGFAFVPPDIMPAMLKLQQHLLTCACSFVQAGAVAAFGEPPRPEVLNLWRSWEDRCAYMTSGLNSIPGVTCHMPEGGFYGWLNISGTGYRSDQLAEKLLDENHVAVVPGSAFGNSGEGYLRITCVKSRAELDEGLGRIQQALSRCFASA